MYGNLGAGLSLRRCFLPELARRLSQGEEVPGLDWAELVPENFVGRGGPLRRALFEVAEALPIAFHGVTLSIGGTDPLDSELLTEIKKLARDLKPRWYSDHLCFASAQGVQFHNLIPLPRTREAVNHVVSRIQEVQDFMGIPFGLENPSVYAEAPGAEMSEIEFLCEISRRSGCGLLLDINNVFVNSFNGQGPAPDLETAFRTAAKFLDAVPAGRVFEIHIAGHHETQIESDSILLDTHGTPVRAEVRKLLSHWAERQGVATLLLEREANVPPLDDLLTELRSLWALTQSSMGLRLGSAERVSHVEAR